MQSTPDEVLIGRIANGDRLAMQVLYARYHVRVFRFVVRLVRDEVTAEDVISEVFLDVWRQADRFEGRATVSTWLLAIARFKAISALRRRRDEELDEEAAAAIEDLSDNPATALEKNDKSAMLRKCLAGLFGRLSEALLYSILLRSRRHYGCFPQSLRWRVLDTRLGRSPSRGPRLSRMHLP